MEPTEAKNTANEKLTHNKENTGKEAGTAPKEKIVLESGKNSSDKDKQRFFTSMPSQEAFPRRNCV